LISFVWVLGGLTVGWIAIAIHQTILNKKATTNVESYIKQSQSGLIEPGQSLFTLIQQEKGAIGERKTLYQRMVSYKAFHGVIMFISWFNIAGRIFVTKPITDFSCHTYPVFKPEYQTNPDGSLMAVPSVDPSYGRQPWANREGTWAAITFFSPMALALIVGVVVAYIGVRRSRINQENGAEGGAKKTNEAI
jgi:hypothetical protein